MILSVDLVALTSNKKIQNFLYSQLTALGDEVHQVSRRDTTIGFIVMIMEARGG